MRHWKMHLVNVTTNQQIGTIIPLSIGGSGWKKDIDMGKKCVCVKKAKTACCWMLRAITSIKGNVCLCPEEWAGLCATLNPVLPAPLPLWVALDFHRFPSCSQQCTPLHLKSLKRSEAPKSPTAAISPWRCGSSRGSKKTLQHLIPASYKGLLSFCWNLSLP